MKPGARSMRLRVRRLAKKHQKAKTCDAAADATSSGLCLTSLGSREMKSRWNCGSITCIMCLTCVGSQLSMSSSSARSFSVPLQLWGGESMHVSVCVCMRVTSTDVDKVTTKITSTLINTVGGDQRIKAKIFHLFSYIAGVTHRIVKSR
uniref:Uncharacterized protein n=1 Tax=Paramormyrops kingsleyae TaxID=1676925 RepID=A0A3B3TBR7_9TELE